MDWSPYMQTAIGVIVSVLLFLLGYRQTVGAQKERARAASEAVYRALLRRVALENYEPRRVELSRLIKGKAQQFQVRERSLPTAERVLTRLFADVFDNDLIGPASRPEIQKRIAAALDEAIVPREEPGVSLDIFSRAMNVFGPVLIIAVLASIAGLLVASSPEIFMGTLQTDSAKKALLFIGAAVLTTLLVRLIPDLSLGLGSDLVAGFLSWTMSGSLEHRVLRTLESLNLSYRVGGLIGDFTIELDGKTVSLVLREWKGRVELSEVGKLLRSLQRLRQHVPVDQIVVVIRGALRDFPTKAFTEALIEVLPVRDLETYLSNLSAPPAVQ